MYASELTLHTLNQTADEIFSVLVIQIFLGTIFSLIWEGSLAKPQLLSFLYTHMVFRFFFMFHFLYYRGFFNPFSLLLMRSQGELFTLQFRQTLRAAEVEGNYSCRWRLCRLPRKTKKKIFQQQVAAQVSTCDLPAQLTLGNLPYSIFLQQITLFSSPTLQSPQRQTSQVAVPQKERISHHPDTTHCLKSMLWKVIFIYPVNLQCQRQCRAKAWE